ncbi:hypothetical protein [Moorena bouillonii]|nr:hypothetical protein [Moorena bouillonii]
MIAIDLWPKGHATRTVTLRDRITGFLARGRGRSRALGELGQT